jgi:hypothetical protein
VFRRFLIAVVLFLIVILVAADRLGAIVGAHVLATKLQADERLPSRPSTSIGGFPFLTQAVGGKYSDVTVTASAVPVNSVTVTTLTAHLHGVHVPLGKVIHGSVSQVPVNRVDGTAYVSYADANSYLEGHSPPGALVSLAPGVGGQLRVTEKARVAGHRVSLTGTGRVTVVGHNVVNVAITSLKASTKAAGVALSAAIPLRLRHVSIPLPGLPFRFTLTSVTASATGVTASGSATHVVLGSHSGD